MTPVMPKQDNATANVTSKETNVTLVPLTIMVFLTVTVSFHAYYLSIVYLANNIFHFVTSKTRSEKYS